MIKLMLIVQKMLVIVAALVTRVMMMVRYCRLETAESLARLQMT